MSDKRKYKKDSFTGKKGIHGTGKKTQIPITLTEGLAATDKCEGRWLFLQGSSVTDVWRDCKYSCVWDFHHWGCTREFWTLPAS